MKGLLRGELGNSNYSHQPVMEDIKQYFPATLELTFFSMLITILIGIPLGVISASKKDKLADQFARVLALVGVAMPAFWLGIIFLLFFLFNTWYTSWFRATRYWTRTTGNDYRNVHN